MDIRRIWESDSHGRAMAGGRQVMDIRRIWESDSHGRAQAEALLKQEGISLYQHLDYTLGLYEEDRLLVTGSFYRNTLRCLAVDRECQGEGLMATLVSQLSQELFSRGVVRGRFFDD